MVCQYFPDGPVTTKRALERVGFYRDAFLGIGYISYTCTPIMNNGIHAIIMIETNDEFMVSVLKPIFEGEFGISRHTMI